MRKTSTSIMKDSEVKILLFFFSAIVSIINAKKSSNKGPNMSKDTKKMTKSKSSALRIEATQILEGCGDELIVVTRIHTTSALKIAEPKVVENFIVTAAKYACKIVICVGFNDKDHMDSELIVNCASYITQLENHIMVKLGSATLQKILFLPIHPWGNYTTALNCALLRAMKEQQRYICYQSLEFRIDKSTVYELIDYMKKDPNYLVVGPCLPGHDFLTGGRGLSAGAHMPLEYLRNLVSGSSWSSWLSSGRGWYGHQTWWSRGSRSSSFSAAPVP